MVSKDHKTLIAPVILKEPADLAHTNTTSDILDTFGFESATVAISVSALTGVDGSNYVTFKLQESDTTANADFTDVAAADQIGAFTVVNSTTKDSVVQMVGYKGAKRYVRAVATYTGTSISAGVIGMFGILADARDLPATAPAAVTAT